MDSFTVTSHGSGQTARIAAVLARRLSPGDVVLLTGELAAGKTTFVKGVAAALGSTDPVTSPTFSLAQFYSAEKAPILHIDTYRLSGVEEYRDLGLDEYLETSVGLIEWGDKVSAEFPCHLGIEFQPGTDGADSRTLRFASSCHRWAVALDGLREDIVAEAS